MKEIDKNKTNSDVILFTLGYEGLKPEEFIKRLKEKNIEVLIDVREIAWSRKKGFSKSQLENIVNQYGIKYIHMKKLGNPSVIRKKIKEKGGFDFFVNEYQNYIRTQTEELKNLQKMINKFVCCLMCFEKNVNMCHRKILTSEIEKLSNNKIKVLHL